MYKIIKSGCLIKVIWITALLLFASFCKAEWIIYTTDDGLADDDVLSIAIDASGNIWFGTDGGGISKFDGNNWTQYNKSQGDISNDEIYAVAVDTSGHIWVGTRGGGVWEFDGSGWSSYTKVNTGGGLIADDIQSLAVPASGNKWFGSRHDGVSRYDGSWSSYTTSNSDLVSDVVYAVAEDESGTAWFGTNGQGISRYDAGQWTTYTRDNTNSGLASDYISVIAEDAGGNMWFGTIKGVSVLNTRGNWTTYDKSNSGLPGNSITAISIDDSTGDIWFGTEDGGISKFDGEKWITYDAENSDLPSNYVNSIAITNSKNIWVGTNFGVGKLTTRDIEPSESEVKIQGGVEGYVTPRSGETAKIHFRASQPGRVTVRIYTLNGHLVWDQSKNTGGGKDLIVWDCINNNKSPVCSGVYIVYIEGPGIDSIKKVAVVR